MESVWISLTTRCQQAMFATSVTSESELNSQPRIWTIESPPPPARPEGGPPSLATANPHDRSVRGLCPVCRRTFQVTKAGLIRPHGPTNNRCSGSGNPPAHISLPPCSSAIRTPSNITSEAMPLDTISFRPTTKILKRIPASRHLAANRLATILDAISTKNNNDAWERLFRFPSRCLRAPKRGGHRRSLASEVNQQLRDEADPMPSQPPSCSHSKRRGDPLNTLATRVATKLEEGDFKGAVHLACSEDSIANLDEETMAALKSKHPSPHPDTQIPPLLQGSTLSTHAPEEVAARAILSAHST